jgi:Flp pilus assembly protein TadD
LSAAIVVFLRWPAAGFLGVVFFLKLAPTSSIVPIDTEVGAERRMYVPMMALSTLAVTTLRALLDRLLARAGTWSRAIVAGATAVCVAVLAALGIATIRRNEEYSDRVTLWRTVVDRRPHGRARFSYASALIAAGDHERALAELREAVADYDGARYALGVELIFAGEVDQGIQELREFIRLAPGDPARLPARSLLARSLASKGDLDGAAGEFRAILETAPTNLEARAQLGEILLVQKRFDEAAVEFRSAAERVRNPAIELGLGIALLEAGHVEEAVEHLELAVELDPKSAQAHRALAQAEFRLERLSAAILHAEEAVRLDPRNAAGHNLLGAALASEGRLDEAIGHFRQALQIAPDDERTRDFLMRAQNLRAGRQPVEGAAR